MRLPKMLTRYFREDYDATVSSGRRRPPSRITSSEDRVADATRRRVLSASARDLARNFAIAAWAIRKHLDYVSTFTFQPKSGDAGLDLALTEWFNEQAKRENFDAAERHPFRRAIRLAEACRVKDGDVALLKLTGGKRRGRIQAIEADRIYLPPGERDPAQNWVNGVLCDDAGRATAYAICQRVGSSLELEKTVPARSIMLHSGYDRFDQVRGISPIASALNWFRDTYEGFEYALAKAKVAQLFGLSIYREADAGAFPESTTATYDSDDDGVADSGYNVALGKGPFMLDLEPGDRAEILESGTPASETVDFLKLMVHVALKSLDIPYSFFDESFTNFYGSRGGLIQYLKSCKDEIADLVELQNEWFAWRLGLAVFDGEFDLDPSYFDSVFWEFVPAGVPWWDPTKEVAGQKESVAAGFTSPQRVCREIGTDFETNIREIAEAHRIATEAGVTLSYDTPAAAGPPGSGPPDDEDPESDEDVTDEVVDDEDEDETDEVDNA